MSLFVFIGLATVLTFFVITSFWLRDAALSLARAKEIELALLVQKSDYQQAGLHEEAVSFAALMAESVGLAGAAGGCSLAGDGELSCVGANPPERAILEEAQISGQSVRSLTGQAWMTFVPGKKYLDLAVRLTPSGQEMGAIALRFSLEPLYAGIRSSQRYIALYLGVNLIILLVIAFLRFHRGIIRPVEHLIRLTDSYTDEGGVPFLAPEGGNELGQLAGSMQQMLGRIRADREKLQQHVASLENANQQLIATREEMVRTEKLSSVGRLAAGLAHEIGNPLGIVQGYLGLIGQQDLSEQERREFCDRAEREVQRITQLVRQLLDLSRPLSGINENVDIHQVLTEVIALLRPQPLLDGIELTTRFAAVDASVHGNAAQLLQVFLNCLINAVDAIHAVAGIEHRGIEVATDSVTRESGEAVRVTIADNGAGLAEEEVANAFDPFFTTKEPGKGTGLGLAVSYALLKAMGGSISLANREGGGAVVTIILPSAGR